MDEKARSQRLVECEEEECGAHKYSAQSCSVSPLPLPQPWGTSVVKELSRRLVLEVLVLGSCSRYRLP